ncbi:Cytoplasmic protein [Entamoeba marina]
MGGKPYLPNDFEYPKTYDEPHPLAFLAQNNFEDFEDFPNKGKLDDDLTNSNGFCVIYHENIVTDESLLVDLPEMSEGQLPFNKIISVKLVGKKSDMVMSMNDFRMDDLIEKGCYEGKYKDYLVTLFTSESGTGTMWWDEGVANFFIKKEDLMKRNFNDVLYTWDSN